MRPISKLRPLIVFILVIATSGCGSSRRWYNEANGPDEEIIVLDPPDQGFYAKELDCMGIPIKSSSNVTDDALHEAADRIKLMLQHLPTALTNIMNHGMEIHILGRREKPSEMPENRSVRSNTEVKAHSDEPWISFDARARGYVTDCCVIPEENLVHLIDDGHRGKDVGIHEFAHVIMGYGLNSSIRKRIAHQFDSSMSHGLWAGKYAHENSGEFFAELSTWYFGYHGSDDDDDVGTGPEALRKYDPEAYKLVDDIYSNRLRLEIALHPADSLKSFVPDENLRPELGERTGVIFVNHRKDSVTLFWVDKKGAIAIRHKILPDSRYFQHTVRGQLWIVGTGSEALCEYRSDSKIRFANIW